MIYTKEKVGNALDIQGFVDADWAGSKFVGCPHPDIVLNLVEPQWYGRVRNKHLWLDHLLRLNIGQLLRQPQNLYGSDYYLKSWDLIL